MLICCFPKKVCLWYSLILLSFVVLCKLFPPVSHSLEATNLGCSVSSYTGCRSLWMHCYFSLTKLHALNRLGSRWQGISSLSVVNQAQRQGSSSQPSSLRMRVPWLQSFCPLFTCSPALCGSKSHNTPQGMTHQAVAPPSCKENVLISPHPRVLWGVLVSLESTIFCTTYHNQEPQGIHLGFPPRPHILR